MRFDYQAKRKLQGGVSENDPIVVEFPGMTFTTTHTPNISETRALNNSVEAVLHSINTEYALTLTHYEESVRADLQQFLFSVMGKEPFTFDLRGTAATLDDPISVRIKSNGFTEEKIRTKSDGTFTFRTSFVIEEI